MNYEEFKEQLVEDVKNGLQERTGKEYEIQTNSVEKDE